jgi:hypothetical protein
MLHVPQLGLRLGKVSCSALDFGTSKNICKGSLAASRRTCGRGGETILDRAVDEAAQSPIPSQWNPEE